MNNLILFLFSFPLLPLYSYPLPALPTTLSYNAILAHPQVYRELKYQWGLFTFSTLMKSDQLSLFLLFRQKKKVHHIYKKRNIMPSNCSPSSVCVCVIVLRVVPCPAVPLRLCACQQSPFLLSPLSCYFCPVLM